MNNLVGILLVLIFFAIILAMIVTYREQIRSPGNWRNYMKQRIREVKSGKSSRCPRGCDRGLCRTNLGTVTGTGTDIGKNCLGEWKTRGGHKKCRYDFECKYCDDRLTGVAYKMDLKTEFPEIKYHYNRIDNKYIDNLNEKIVRENRYIGKINKSVRKINQKL